MCSYVKYTMRYISLVQANTNTHKYNFRNNSNNGVLCAHYGFIVIPSSICKHFTCLRVAFPLSPYLYVYISFDVYKQRNVQRTAYISPQFSFSNIKTMASNKEILNPSKDLTKQSFHANKTTRTNFLFKRTDSLLFTC